jgi:hypothetical protein
MCRFVLVGLTLSLLGGGLGCSSTRATVTQLTQSGMVVGHWENVEVSIGRDGAVRLDSSGTTVAGGVIVKEYKGGSVRPNQPVKSEVVVFASDGQPMFVWLATRAHMDGKQVCLTDACSGRQFWISSPGAIQIRPWRPETVVIPPQASVPQPTPTNVPPAQSTPPTYLPAPRPLSPSPAPSKPAALPPGVPEYLPPTNPGNPPAILLPPVAVPDTTRPETPSDLPPAVPAPVPPELLPPQNVPVPKIPSPTGPPASPRPSLPPYFNPTLTAKADR